MLEVMELNKLYNLISLCVCYYETRARPGDALQTLLSLIVLHRDPLPPKALPRHQIQAEVTP